jgi:hypothetical protein
LKLKYAKFRIEKKIWPFKNNQACSSFSNHIQLQYNRSFEYLIGLNRPGQKLSF